MAEQRLMEMPEQDEVAPQEDEQPHHKSRSVVVARFRSNDGYQCISGSSLKEKESKRDLTCWKRFLRRLKDGDFVLDPRQGGYLFAWDLVVWCLVVLAAIVTPFEVCFMLSTTFALRIFNYVQDVVFVIDMCLQFITMYPSDDEMRWVRNPSQIACRYFKGLFLADLLAIIPLRALLTKVRASFELREFSHMIRLCRLARLNRLRLLIDRYEASVDMPYHMMRIPQFMLIVAYTSHLMACAWGWAGGLQGKYTWVNAVADAKSHDPSHDVLHFYLQSLYWAVMTITSIGYGDIVPQNGFEYLICTMAMAVGGVTWAYAIGTVCGVISALESDRIQHEQTMDNLNQMMRDQELPKSLRQSLRMFFLRRRYSRGLKQHKAILDELSPSLRAQVVRFQVDAILRKVPYMASAVGSSDLLLVRLQSQISQTMFAPKELIDYPQTLCAMYKGLAMKGTKLLSRGDVWGEGDVLLVSPHLLENCVAVAISYAEVLHISKLHLDDLEEVFPWFSIRIRKARVRYAVFRNFLHHARLQKDANFANEAAPNRSLENRKALHNISVDLRLEHIELKQESMLKILSSLQSCVLHSNLHKPTSILGNMRTAMHMEGDGGEPNTATPLSSILNSATNAMAVGANNMIGAAKRSSGF